MTVAREIVLEDPVENMGARMIKDVASLTAEVAGDGTTTATVLASEIIMQGMKHIAKGANPMDIKKGIDKAVKAVAKHLDNQTQKVDGDNLKVKQIGTISANNDEEIGNLIAEAMEKVQSDGIITVEEAKGIDRYIDIAE